MRWQGTRNGGARKNNGEESGNAVREKRKEIKEKEKVAENTAKEMRMKRYCFYCPLTQGHHRYRHPITGIERKKLPCHVCAVILREKKQGVILNFLRFRYQI